MMGASWRAFMPTVAMAVATMVMWRVDRDVARRVPSVGPSISDQELSERFPMPPPFVLPSEEASALLRVAVEAAPFSPERHYVPEPETSAAAGGAGSVAAALPPIFVYKGQIVMGAVKRAVLEDSRAGKTHFLQVGQEVAGFKVLDIDENRVVLSDLKTQDSMTVSRSPQTAP